MDLTLQKPFTRNADLDVVKGMLVIVMLFYHCASVAEHSRFWHDLHWVLNRLQFIHFAFLIISGFLCGWYYLPKLEREPDSVRRRLRIRGLKIIGLMIFFNIILYSLGIAYQWEQFRTSISTVRGVLDNFILNANGDLVAFEILYYIGIFLLAASALLGRVGAGTIAILAVILLFASPATNVTMVVSQGLLGMVIGMLTVQGRLAACWGFIEKSRGIPVYLIFCAYQLFLSDIRVIMGKRGMIWLPLFFETILWFLVFVFLFRMLKRHAVTSVALLGKYTLFGYIVQMLIARIVYHLLRRVDMPGLVYYFASVIVSGSLLVICILTMDRLRHRSHTVNTLYRLVME